MIVLRLTSTAQCERETSASSISISAPPPSRPIVINGLDTANSVPCDLPASTEIVTLLPAGSVRVVVGATPSCGIRTAPLVLSGLRRNAIVGGLTSCAGSVAAWIGRLHIQQVVSVWAPVSLFVRSRAPQ